MKPYVPEPFAVAVIALTMPDGDARQRIVMSDEPMPEELKTPPTWLLNAGKKWEHPTDPIVYYGHVRRGFENEAEALLAAPSAPTGGGPQ